MVQHKPHFVQLRSVFLSDVHLGAGGLPATAHQPGGGAGLQGRDLIRLRRAAGRLTPGTDVGWVEADMLALLVQQSRPLTLRNHRNLSP